MLRTVFSVAIVPIVLSSAPSWKLGPEKRLPAFRNTSSPPGSLVQSWTFAEGVEDWHPRSGTVQLSHEPAIGHTSSGCLRVRGHDEGNWNFVWSPRFEVRAGAAYHVSLWLRVGALEDHPPPTFYFKAQMFAPEGKRGGALINSNRAPATVSAAWKELELTFTVPPTGLDGVALALEKGTQDRVGVSVCIDDVLITEIRPEDIEAVWKDATLTGPIAAELRGIHPRLYLTTDHIAFLRNAIRTDPHWEAMFAVIRKYAETAVRHAPPDYAEQMKNHKEGKPAGSHEQLWQRGVGNRIPSIALAYLLTDDPRYLTAAKAWGFTALDYPTWGIGRMAGLDLAAGHILAGIGLAYDWLYHDLTEDERRQIREKVVPRAEKLAHAGFSKIPFWHQAYLQNHLWVSVAGMATTAFAVADEVPEATSWICFAHDKFIRTLEALGDDGASHEGYGYWEYGAEYIMRYLELADTCLGIDLYHDSSGVPHPWLSRNSAYALYLALPRGMWTRKQSIVDLADCPRNHWYGPSYLLRNLARRYPEPPWQGTAQWLAAEFEAAGVDVTGSGHYLNFAWHNPRIPARPPKDDTLPLWHHFDDIGIVSARSDWENDAALLVVTCGPPLGHRHAASMKDYGAGHVHPDAGHFVLVAGGETLFRDSGYTAPKLTGNHSTLLIKDKEQKGGGKTWYVYGDWLLDERVPTIQSVTNTDDQTVIDCAVAGAYPAHVGLRTFDRTFEFARSGTLTIRDRVALETESALEWRLQTEGPLEQLSDTEWRTTVGRMSATIRIRADVPVVLNAGSLEINQHLRTQTRPYLAVKTTGSVTRAQLETVIDWRGNAP